ncbi:hypothetical protein [Maridesulfovibrio sp.]|uniref:hypothetical protein n=1 Tax=Maridesulfovibrio sp. TaxID=2795000 RepID=UPI002A18D7E2|nr:hypothetical protein [Maridesulfovibrio sp.]
MTGSYEKLADWLEGEALQIREIEKEASSALHDNSDEQAYRELMRSKAVRLAEMADNSESYMIGLKDDDRKRIAKRLKRFSSSASTSLEIGSVFFMSALLYPEDYVDGEKNDLESFADMVRSSGVSG